MKFKAVCPRDCYGGCSLILEVEAGRIVKIEGDKENRATEGIICRKGIEYISRNYGRNRLKKALKRVGDKGKGEFKEISIEEALDEVAKRIMEVQEKDPLSFLFYKGAGELGTASRVYNNFINQLKGYTYVYGDLCSAAGLEALKLTYGSVEHNAPWDLEKSKLIVIWGKNTANTNIQELVHIKRAKEKGAKVVLIDIRRSETAKYADLVITPEVGTDLVLAMAIHKYIIQNNKYDVNFVNNYTYGFNEFKLEVQKYSLEYAQEVTKVPKDKIVEVAELISNIKPFTLICGFGIQRQIQGGQTVRALSLLPALVGSVGIEGGGFRYSNHTRPRLNLKTIKPIKNTRGINVVNMGQEIKDKGIKCMLIQAANPVMSNPNSNALREALKEIEFLVCIDTVVSETAKYADIILPAAATFEYYDVLRSYWHPYIMLHEKVVEPLGDSMHESRIYRELADRMGLNKDLIPENNLEFIEEVLKYSKINVSIDTLRKGPYLTDDYCEVVYKDLKFNTPSGKIEFKVDGMKKWGENELPIYKEFDEVGPFKLISIHSRDVTNSQYLNIPSILDNMEEPYAYINKDDADRLGINHGEKMIIFNSLSSITLRAKTTYDVRRGHVVVPFGQNIDLNSLIEGRNTDIGLCTAFHNIGVNIKKF
ncbi:molybdopterin-containing oxidoreductase family protein [Thermobrachium celere]|uniref:molybdopterin-containing oxidoreductase family protein n=1 Tax=Thermobrachium celere TaxID=53422 RepID=UPI001941DE66|nr:molybdopterin-dependent oxidoreductase [Thermobrachium celere]GFR34493.1 dehydrogenase [Thermobrachium celere]